MRIALPFVALSVLVFATAVSGAGLTGYLDPLESDLVARRAELAGNTDKASKKALKTIDKSLAALRKDSVSESYAGELKGAAKAGKLVEKKLAGEAGLQARLGELVANYTELLTAARNELAAAPVGSAKEGKKRDKALKKADKGLAKSAANQSPSKQLKILAGVAKTVADHIAVDDGLSYLWVISEVSVAPEGTGRDLDGDGSVDNALGALAPLLEAVGIDVAQMIDDSLATSDQVGLIEMWMIDSFDGDDLVRAGLMNGIDTDFDPSDNFSGEESFQAQDGAVAVDGHPVLRTTTSFAAGGAYEVEFTGEAVGFVGFELPGDVSYGITGTASPASNSGVIGFAIPVDRILDYLAAQGIDVGFATELVIRAAMDLDLDGDGANDAISAAFEFDSVPAGLF